MRKEAKVKTVELWDKKDSKGNSTATVEFENGDRGFYTSPENQIHHFKVGETMAYDIEEKKKRNGGVWYSITIPETTPTGAPAANYGKDYEKESLYMACTMAAAYVKDLVVAGKIEVEDFSSHYKILLEEMNKAILNVK